MLLPNFISKEYITAFLLGPTNGWYGKFAKSMFMSLETQKGKCGRRTLTLLENSWECVFEWKNINGNRWIQGLSGFYHDIQKFIQAKRIIIGGPVDGYNNVR